LNSSYKKMKYSLFKTRYGLLDTDTIDWLSSNQKPNRIDLEPIEIKSLQNLLPKYTKYNDVPLQEFWNFLMDLMMIFTDLNELVISDNSIHDELKGIKAILLWWIYTEGHLITIKGLDYTFLNVERQSVNHLFRTKACHVWSIIEARIPSIPVFMDDRLAINKSKPEDLEELMGMIRDSCMGDLDEMVVYCMDYIKKKMITAHHVKLANITRLVYDPNSTVDETPTEAWRVLFPRFFDDSGKSFQTFTSTYLNFSILFFMEDYLQINMSHISIIPFTYPDFLVRGADGMAAADVLFFYGIEFFRDRVRFIKQLGESS